MSNQPGSMHPQVDQAPRAQQPHPSGILPYALLSLGAFACAVLLFILMLRNMDKLIVGGLVGQAYYLVLVLIGSAVATSVFGAVRSIGRYRGHQFGGTLELGGPALGLALVIVGGALFPPTRDDFSLTVFVQGEEARQGIVLRNQCNVILDLEGDRRQERIGDKGQVVFQKIPGSLRGHEARIFLDDCPDFEVVDSDGKYRLNSGSLYLSVRRKSGRVAGTILDEGGGPIPDARVDIAGLSTYTDAGGHFEFTVPGDRLERELELRVTAKGFAPGHLSNVVANANDVSLRLSPHR